MLLLETFGEMRGERGGFWANFGCFCLALKNWKSDIYHGENFDFRLPNHHFNSFQAASI